MKKHAGTCRSSISMLNPNDVENAVLAIVAVRLTQPEFEEDDYGHYDDMANAIIEEHCPLLRAMECDMALNTIGAIHSEVSKMDRKLRSSKDPLFRALAGKPRTIAQ